MSESGQAGGLRPDGTALLVCDAGGRVQAMSPNAAANPLLGNAAAQKHYAEVFGRESSLTFWLTEQINIARKQGDCAAESNFEDGGQALAIRLEALKTDGELYGFALYISPKGSPIKRCVLSEGDAVVTRQQWHDIKNHLGGLKLYATFLKRKLPDGDDRQTVEKMLNGIDGLIEHLARIRRGEAQTGTEG